MGLPETRTPHDRTSCTTVRKRPFPDTQTQSGAGVIATHAGANLLISYFAAQDSFGSSGP